MRQITTLFLLFSAIILSCNPGSKDTASWHKDPIARVAPESQGFSSEGLMGMDSLFLRYIDQDQIAGATALVARRGKIVYYKSIGYDDLEQEIPLVIDAIFRIASQTKGITSVAVMMLIEEGKISLDDPISMYLPEFAKPHVINDYFGADTTYSSKPAHREVTILDLLTQRSGYFYPGSGGEAITAIYAKNKITDWVPTKSSTLKKEMRKLAGIPLAHEPGEKFSYGLSTNILGYLVEVLSGVTLEEFFTTRIFKPLGMEDTYFSVPEEKHYRLMNLYQDDPSTGGIIKSSNPFVDFPKNEDIYFSGGGGLSSTTLDYAIFQQMLLNEGIYNGTRILAGKTIQMMRQNHIGACETFSLFILGFPDKFGLGFEVISPPGSDKSLMTEGSYGWGGAFGSLYWIDPQTELIAHLVIQKAGSYNNLRYDFIKAVYKALKP